LQRKALVATLSKLQAQKQKLAEKVAERKKFLEAITTQLKSVKKAALPVEQSLGLERQKDLKQHRLAELLPAPLYVLYTQLLAYKEAVDDGIEVEVQGSSKEAEALALLEVSKVLSSRKSALEGSEEEQARKRQRTGDEVEQSGYQTHPLVVSMQVRGSASKGNDEKSSVIVQVRFEYLRQLNLVAAQALTPGGKVDESGILKRLFPDDAGEEAPTEVSGRGTFLLNSACLGDRGPASSRGLDFCHLKIVSFAQ
jgi:THO complex subunit 5